MEWYYPVGRGHLVLVMYGDTRLFAFIFTAELVEVFDYFGKFLIDSGIVSMAIC
jgi:hypothetical protein